MIMLKLIVVKIESCFEILPDSIMSCDTYSFNNISSIKFL